MNVAKNEVLHAMYSKTVKYCGAVYMNFDDEHDKYAFYSMLKKNCDVCYVSRSKDMIHSHYEKIDTDTHHFNSEEKCIFNFSDINDDFIQEIKEKLSSYSAVSGVSNERKTIRKLGQRNDLQFQCDFSSKYLSIIVYAGGAKLVQLQKAIFSSDDDLKFIFKSLRESIENTSGDSLESYVSDANRYWNISVP